MNTVLTFDLGTTYFKACLFDTSLTLVAHYRVAAPVDQSECGAVEMPVPAFEGCLTSAAMGLAREVGGLSDVTRICFASQANGFTLLDCQDQPLLPFLLWTDQRAAELEPLWRDFVNSPNFSTTTGIAEFDHHFLPAKVLWLARNNPHQLQQVRQLSGISDYLVWWLTGHHATEASFAALAGLIDARTCEYWSGALTHFGIRLKWLPPVLRAGDVVGPIRSQFVESWGVHNDCQVVMGCLDQYAGAIGAGVELAGDVGETTGTVLSTVACSRQWMTDARRDIFQGPSSVPDVFYRMIFSRIGAGLLEKYRNHLPDRPSFDELDALAAKVPFGCNGLELHPNAPELPIEGWFIGRQPIHDRGHEVRVILEAVAKQLKRQVATICGGDKPNVLRSVGGAARSRVWTDIKSRELGCRVEPVDCLEATSLGAAKLAIRRSDLAGIS